jgi:hypothetical protein
MRRAGISEHDQARDRLFQEGARSYLKAANALIAFQREVQKKCRKVMARYVGEYGSALKVDLETSEIVDLAWPKFDEWEGEYASIGVHVVRRDIAGVRWWEAYCTLEWECDDPGFYCYVGEWFPTRKIATDLCQRFKRLNPEVEVFEGNIGIRHSLKPEQAPDFEERLDDLLQKWIKLWKKTGGMKAVFKP